MTYTPIPQKSAFAGGGSGPNQSSGFSSTIPDGCTIFIVNAATLLAAGTIILPLNPTDGQALSIECPKGITLLTLTPNTGQSLSNSFVVVSLGVNAASRLKYAQINSTWYPN